jgi:hypothetical protein
MLSLLREKKISGIIVFYCVLACFIVHGRDAFHCVPDIASAIPQSEIRIRQLNVPRLPKKNSTWDKAGQRGTTRDTADL